MLKNTKITVYAGLLAGMMLSSCSKEPNFKTSENGLKYYFFKDVEGETAKVGDYLTLNFEYKTKVKGTDNDTILRNTWKDGFPIQVVVQEPSFKGGLEEGLMLLSVGDSVAFKLPVDSLFKKTFYAPIPDFIDSTGFIIFTMKVDKIQNREEFEKEQSAAMEERRRKMMEDMEKQKDIDDKLIQEYLTANKINAQKTATGLYYVVKKAGKGKKAAQGTMVSVNYVGKLLNGNEFDSSKDKSFEFKVGVGQVIPGWDEGISLLSEGSTATLYIPSNLGYGPMAMGEQLPANSILVFDVEVTKVK